MIEEFLLFGSDHWTGSRLRGRQIVLAHTSWPWDPSCMMDDVSLKGRRRNDGDMDMVMGVGGDVNVGTCQQTLDRHRQT